jgi:hypothetical protein
MVWGIFAGKHGALIGRSKLVLFVNNSDCCLHINSATISISLIDKNMPWNCVMHVPEASNVTGGGNEAPGTRIKGSSA